jgi:2-iminobutanoate/2-iminopropanoate deaminase
MNKEIIYTKNAPEPIGPYSQGVKVGNMLFLSGQVAINPSTGELVMDTIQNETMQVMKNIEALLQEANTNFDAIVKTTIFLSDMALFAEVNEVYGKFFNAAPPARETVAVKGLPKNVNVEISVTAFL